MIRSLYSRKVILANTAMVVVALAAVKLQGYADEIEENVLRLLVRGLVHVADVSIAAGIVVTAEFDGGLFLLYLFKSILQAWSQEYSIAEIVGMAVAWYMLNHMAVLVLVKLCRHEEVDFRDIQQRAKFTVNEQKRRIVNLTVSFTILLLLLNTCLHSKILNAPFLIFVVNILGVLFELYLIHGEEECLSNLMASTLNYKLYLYILLNIFLAKQYGMFAFDMMVYLFLSFFTIRAYIGSKSSKFHKGDVILFDMVYIFKGDKGHKYYRNSGNEQRILKHLDRLSREIAIILYFLAFYLTITQNEMVVCLIAAIALINNYPLQQSRKLPFVSYLQGKLKKSINVRPLLSLPILILFFWIENREKSRQESIYDTMNGCTTVNHYQNILFVTFFISAFLTQFVQTIKGRIYRFIELCSPLIIILWTAWLECIHFKHVLLGAYVLAFSFETIRQGNMAKRKGGKKD